MLSSLVWRENKNQSGKTPKGDGTGTEMAKVSPAEDGELAFESSLP